MSGGLTWGQRFVWDILESLAPVNHYLSIRFRVHLPRDVTPERVREVMRALTDRHEGLRTRFGTGPDGEPWQRPDPPGDPEVTVLQATPGTVRRLAEQEEDRLWKRSFRHDAEWPVRVTVVAAGGRARQAVFVFSHLVADAWGCAVFRREFLALLRGETLDPRTPGRSPLQRAAYERTGEARAAGDLALRHWRRVLETAPPTAFPVRPEAGESPLFPGAALDSVALAAAVRAAAARHRAGPTAVLLAVLATMIAARTGAGEVPLMLAAANRFTPEDVASVGTFYLVVPVSIKVDRGSLAATVREAHRACTVAYLRGAADPVATGRLLAEAGTDLMATTVNVAAEPDSPAIPAAAPDAALLRSLTEQTVVTGLEGRDSEQLKLYFHVKALRSRAVVELFCDSRYLSAAGARRVLAGLELVLIDLLDTGDLDVTRVAALAGIEPLPSLYAHPGA